MELPYRFTDDSSLADVVFMGLTGREYVTSTKDALNVMKIKNPAVDFQECLKAGDFNDVPDEEYKQMLDTIKCIKDLWRYPDEPADSQTQYDMNILALLANAIELISRQNVELRKYREKQ